MQLAACGRGVQRLSSSAFPGAHETTAASVRREQQRRQRDYQQARAAAALRKEGCAVDARGFEAAVKGGNVRLCGLYLDAGMAGTYQEALLDACCEGHVAVCTLLLSRGLDFDAREGAHSSAPLHYAARGGHNELCTLLLYYGADVNVRDTYSYTPLHKAAERGDLTTCAILLDNGADVDAIAYKLYTPLHYAARNADFAVRLCTLLLDRGADVNAHSHDGRPLHLAAMENIGSRGVDQVIKVCALLIDRGADVHIEEVFQAYYRQHSTELYTFLLDSGFDVNAGHQGTALHMGFNYLRSTEQVTEYCNLLLDRGADVDIKDHGGNSPLMLAEKSEYATPELRRRMLACSRET